MFESPVTKITLFFSTLFSLLILLFFLFISSEKSKVVFCNVGQGDGTYIRLDRGFDILVDAGPDNKVLECLGKHMPFYDRSIDLAIISHPQKDHYGGFTGVIDRYNIKFFWLSYILNPTMQYNSILEKIEAKQIIKTYPLAGDEFDLPDAKIKVVWPTEKYILNNSITDIGSPPPFRKTGLNLNNFSLVFILDTEVYRIFFTGDSSPEIMAYFSAHGFRLSNKSQTKITILKVPHHGSKNGLTPEFLKLADPSYGVISLGINNPHGHPSPDILEMLKAQNVIIRRTDLQGDIVFSLRKQY